MDIHDVIVYARVSTNNRADTVLNYFKDAEKLHGRPSRVRCDFGGENFAVADYMLEHRGLNRGSVLTGPSIRNQRIERIWRDCSRSVIRLYSRIFSHLEERDKIFDCGDVKCMVSLHHVYLPRIQRALDEWVRAWNCHPIEGCGNFSPLQLRESGFLQRFGSASNFIREVFDEPLPAAVSEDEYGVEVDDNINDEQDNEQTVSIPELTFEQGASEDALLRRLSDIDPLENDNNFGISLYRKCLEALRC